MMQRSKLERKKSEYFGRLGEKIAEIFLRLKFYTIIGRRVKTNLGEIDIIAKRGKLLIFVEVKIRKNKSKMQEALEAVNKERIYRAAALFLSQNPEYYDYNLRFDVIFIAPSILPYHLAGAFDYLE